jgi:hypothetical protein
MECDVTNLGWMQNCINFLTNSTTVWLQQAQIEIGIPQKE